MYLENCCSTAYLTFNYIYQSISVWTPQKLCLLQHIFTYLFHIYSRNSRPVFYCLKTNPWEDIQFANED